MNEETEIPGTRVAACGSTRCRYNEDLKCTAVTVVISGSGECRKERWVDDKAVGA